MAQGRRSEAVEILAKIRGDVPLDDPELVQELEQLDAIVVASGHKRYQFLNVTFGRYSGKLHLGRRVCLAIGLMLMMECESMLAMKVDHTLILPRDRYSCHHCLRQHPLPDRWLLR